MPDVKESCICFLTCPKTLFKHVSLPAFCGLIIIAAVFFLAVSAGLLLEDIQAALFFLVLCCVAFFFRERNWRVPLSLAGAASILWLGTLIPGVFELRRHSPDVFLSRLQGDTSGLDARALYHRFNEIAEIYRLPGMSLLQSTFKDDAETQRWLERYDRTPFMLRGSKQWLRLVFPGPTAPLARFNLPSLSPDEVPAYLQEAANELHLSLTHNLILARWIPYDLPLVLVFQPEAISIPANDPGLALHLLAWLGKGLSRDRQPPSAGMAARIDAFYQAKQITGPWIESEPLALAYYFLGTMELVEALRDPWGSLSPDGRAARRHLGVAAKRINSKEAPELYSANTNNLALALYTRKPTPKNLIRALIMLQRAAKIRTAAGEPTAGAKAAFLNLLTFNRLIPR